MFLDWWKPLQERRSLIFSGIRETEEPRSIDSDEVLVLESKVVSAMSRLQKSSFNKPDSDGICHSDIVDFLAKNYALDGDIESQVITALQSGIKKGFICGLRNGNYSLVGPSADKTVARCYNTVYHGPNCTCFLINLGKRHCCSFRLGPQSEFVKENCKTVGRRKYLRGQKPKPRKRKKEAPFADCGDASYHVSTSSTAGDTCLKCGKRKIVEGPGSGTDPTTSQSCDISI